MSSQAEAQAAPVAQAPATQITVQPQIPLQPQPQAQLQPQQKPKVPIAIRALKVVKTLELVFRIGHAIAKGAKEGLVEYLDEQNNPPPQPKQPGAVADQFGPRQAG